MSGKTERSLAFIEKWLEQEKEARPQCLVLEAISDATNNGQLDQADLLQRLRALETAGEREESL